MIAFKAFIGTVGMGVLGAIGLAGCIGVPQWEKPGTPRAEVVARLGPPTAVHALPDGQRLQYSQQPAGTTVHNLDFDAAGRLVGVAQVLQANYIELIEPGRWTGPDVEYLLGKPGEVGHVARFDGEVWTYRFKEPSGLLRRLHVHVDRGGVVRQILTTDEDRHRQDPR